MPTVSGLSAVTWRFHVPVPVRGRIQQTLQFRAHGLDVDAVVGVNHDVTQEFGGLVRPVFKRLLQDVRQGHDGSSEAPHLHDDVGSSDLLHLAQYAFGDVGAETTTTSLRRKGCVSALCSPAKRFVRSGWAARPATIPITPAEAGMLVPSARTPGASSASPPPPG
jgi:hypothetical protein